MTLNFLETTLQVIESHLDGVSRALVGGDAVELERQSAVMRDLSVGLSQQLAQLPAEQRIALSSNVNLKTRLKKVSDGLTAQRGGLVRRAVVVDSALAMLMPTSRATGYSAQSSRYGGSARQSGAFKVLSA